MEKERDEFLLLVAASTSSSPPANKSPTLGDGDTCSMPGEGVDARDVRFAAGKHRPRGLVARPRIEGL